MLKYNILSLVVLVKTGQCAESTTASVACIAQAATVFADKQNYACRCLLLIAVGFSLRSQLKVCMAKAQGLCLAKAHYSNHSSPTKDQQVGDSGPLNECCTVISVGFYLLQVSGQDLQGLQMSCSMGTAAQLLLLLQMQPAG